jgi:hypothetical protein
MARNYNIPAPQFNYGGTRLPKWANGLIVVGSLAVVGAIGYYIWKKMNEKAESKDSQSGVNANDNELKDAIKGGQQLSFPQSNYITASNTIFNLLDGCETYNSELQAINEVIKVTRNKADWLNLVKAFGVKKVDNCGWMTGDTTYNLPDLLKDQLDTAGAYSFNEPNFKKSGVAVNSIDILLAYLKTIGVTI